MGVLLLIESQKTNGGNMQKLFVMLSLLLLSSVSIAQQASVSYEPGTDRPGSNYRNFDLEQPDVDFCVEACQKDPRCKAFTYVNPGVQGPKARCWLKDAVPPAKSSSCCISGVKTAGVTQSQSPPPKPMIQGEVKMSPKSGADTSETPSAGGQPSALAHMEKEIIAKIPPASAHRVVKPKTRGELIKLVLSNPRTAPQFNQFASTMGMPAQELATKSSSGKTITGSTVTVPSSGAKISLNWEAGVRFTPKSFGGKIGAYPVYIGEVMEKEYSLSDIYKRDELLIIGMDQSNINFDVPTPPGKYIISVELETQSGVDVNLTYYYSEKNWMDSTRTKTKLYPVADNKALAEGIITSYIGQFEVRNHNNSVHRIYIPLVKNDNINMGIFRGVTITRM
jgi:hypothetical protein